MASCHNKTIRDNYILGGIGGLGENTGPEPPEGTLSKIFNALFLIICVIIFSLMISLMALSIKNKQLYYKLKAEHSTESENNPTLIKDSLEYKLLSYASNPKTEELEIKTIINITYAIFSFIAVYIIILFSMFALFAGVKFYKSLKEKSPEGEGAEAAPEAAPKAAAVPVAAQETAAASAAPETAAASAAPGGKKPVKPFGKAIDKLKGFTAKFKLFNKKKGGARGGMTTEKAVDDVMNGLSMFGGVPKIIDEFRLNVKSQYLIFIVIASILMLIVDEATKKIYMEIVLPDLNKIKYTIQKLRGNIQNYIYPDNDFLVALKQSDTAKMKELIINQLNTGSNGVKNVSKMAFTYNIYQHYIFYFTGNKPDDFDDKFNADALRGVSKTGNFEPAEYLPYTDDEIDKITFTERFMCQFVNDPENRDLLSAIGSNYKPILTDVNSYLKMTNTHSTKLSKSELAINYDSLEEYIEQLRTRSIIAGSLIIGVAVIMIMVYFPDIWERGKALVGYLWGKIKTFLGFM